METASSREKDLELARRCRECPVCRQARRRQGGLAWWFVRWIEGGLCPYCQAYERVYGRKAHEPESAGSGPAAD